MGVCPKGLDADRMNAGESLRDQGGQMPPVRARKHGPRAKNRRDHRKMRARKLLVAPLGAPSPSAYEGGRLPVAPLCCEGPETEGVPGALTKNTGGEALADIPPRHPEALAR